MQAIREQAKPGSAQDSQPVNREQLKIPQSLAELTHQRGRQQRTKKQEN
jgi:hypothetical protein